jgi:hypothetical protein
MRIAKICQDSEQETVSLLMTMQNGLWRQKAAQSILRLRRTGASSASVDIQPPVADAELRPAFIVPSESLAGHSVLLTQAQPAGMRRE